MKQNWFLKACILLGLVGFCLGAPIALAKTLIVDTAILNVRQAPGGKKLGIVQLGQQFKLLEEKSGWGKIEFRLRQYGWVSLDYVRDPSQQKPSVSLEAFCKQLNQSFKQYRWKGIDCDPKDWKAEASSQRGNPLVYAELGSEEPTSMLVCSVHSDENTTYQCFRLLQFLKENPNTLRQRLIIVPLANPDGFLKRRKTRTNARGVDLNRNLPTRDWRSKALRAWKGRYAKNPRRYPGKAPNTEPENHFLLELMLRYQPDKVISIHAPMNFLDLDFIESKPKQHIQHRAETLAIDFSKESEFTLRNYRTFPGSLGRYGEEWNIPIYTLELPSSDPAKHEVYFWRFKDSLVHAFNVIIGTHTARTQPHPNHLM